MHKVFFIIALATFMVSCTTKVDTKQEILEPVYLEDSVDVNGEMMV